MAVTGRYAFTQPETLVVIVLAVVLYSCTYLDTEHLNDVVLNAVHLSAFSLLFGMQFWVTFIAGLTMFKILPRPWFSQVQSVLFKKFFMFATIFSGVAAVSFFIILGDTERKTFKLSGILVVLVGSTINAVFLTPWMNSILVERNAIEKKEKVGQGIGNDNKDCAKLKETNQEYAALYSKFVKLHGASALMNMLAFGGSAIHMLTLAYSLQMV